MRPLRPFLAAVTAGLALAAPAAAAPVETVVQDDAVFLHDDEAGIRNAFRHLQELGFDRLRVTAGWSVIAPEPEATTMPEGFDATDPAAYPHGAWNNLDRAVRLAHEHGIKPMIDIAFWAPRWATTEQNPTERARHDIDAVKLADFARAVARRYSGSYVPPAPPSAEQPQREDDALTKMLRGNRKQPTAPPPPPGEVLPAVDLFTIWNEPNHPGFLMPQWVRQDGRWVPRSPELYRAMIRAVYPAIKEHAPGAQVLIGGTASMGSSTPGKSGVPPLRFLRELACVDERFRPVTTGSCAGFEKLPGDGWAHHPYSLRTTPDAEPKDGDKLPVASTGRLTRALRKLVRLGRLAPANAAVYHTEYGYETNAPDPQAKFSAAEQGRLLAWAERIGTADKAVRMWPQFILRDRPGDPAGPQRRPWGDWQSGLLNVDGSPKPAYSTFRTPVVARCIRVGRHRAVEVWGRDRRAPSAPGSIQVGRKRSGWGAVARSARVRPRTARARAAARARNGEVVQHLRLRAGTTVRVTWGSGAASGPVRVPACRGR